MIAAILSQRRLSVLPRVAAISRCVPASRRLRRPKLQIALRNGMLEKKSPLISNAGTSFFTRLDPLQTLNRPNVNGLTRSRSSNYYAGALGNRQLQVRALDCEGNSHHNQEGNDDAGQHHPAQTRDPGDELDQDR